MREIFEMHPQYEKTESYYGKAKIIADKNMRFLWSYSDLTASYNVDTKELRILFNRGDMPPTTLRHLKEFARQYGYVMDENGMFKRLDIQK